MTEQQAHKIIEQQQQILNELAALHEKQLPVTNFVQSITGAIKSFDFDKAPPAVKMLLNMAGIDITKLKGQK